MSDLRRHVDDYLALRRALGFKLEHEGHVLPKLATYLGQKGSPVLTAELAVAWAQLPRHASAITWSHRLVAARGFATYLRAIDPRTQVPPRHVFGTGSRRPRPYLWSDAEIRALLQAARGLRPPLRAATYEAFFGLLAATGMRLGEATGLARSDVDLTKGVITIKEPKFGRTRLVPLHPSTTAALISYSARRDRLCPDAKRRTGTFFVSGVGTPLLASSVHWTFSTLTTSIGLRTATLRPRIHDLRHSFAVRTLVELYDLGADVTAGLLVLSNYLGHVDPKGTYWYLSATPELMALAAARLEASPGARP